MFRLFVGLSLPENLCQRFLLMQGGIPGASWAVKEDHHLTLAFIGDADEVMAESIHETLQQVMSEPFTLCLQGVDVFADGDKPRVLWAGVEKSDPLLQLQTKVTKALRHNHIPFDERKFTPHVTLARLKRPDRLKLGYFLQEYSLFRSAPFAVDCFHLYHSHQTEDGARYEILESYSLSL